MAPVMYRASSEARNNTALLMSTASTQGIGSKLSSKKSFLASSSVGAGGSDSTFVFAYKDYLKPVKSPQQGDSGNLALKVIAVQSGGRILGPDNDLAGEIGNCIQDANDFYRISFDPPHADHANEYHDLKVVVGKPGVTVRTNTGYYNQPQAETVPAR